jgi:fused signal recognition particle receptor
MGFFARLKQGLTKTTQLLRTDIRDLFKSGGRLVDDQFLEELRRILVGTDMGPQAAKENIDEIGTKFRARVIEMSEAIDIVKAKLKQLMAQDEAPLKLATAGPSVIMVCGVNGSGKTTSIAKLAKLFQSDGKKVVLGAGDTFRAAAVEQLEIWANRAGVDMVRAREGADPAAVVFDAITSGKARGRDPILVDTAGRLHTRVNLMNELDKIRRVAAREVPGAPQEVLLVLDATVGQNGLAQAREFTSVAGVNGIVLTKLDGTAKGGVAVAIANDLKLPIRWVGVGEGIDDLVQFSSTEYVDGLFEEKW